MPEWFFAEVGPRQIDDDDHLPPFEPPARTGPPWHYGYRPVQLDIELGRSDTTVVSLGVARCYGGGTALEVMVRIRESGRQARHRVFPYLGRAHGRGPTDGRFSPDGLRWGVEYDDGRKVTTQDESPWATVESIEDAVIDGPLLEGRARPTVDAGNRSGPLWGESVGPARRATAGDVAWRRTPRGSGVWEPRRIMNR